MTNDHYNTRHLPAILSHVLRCQGSRLKVILVNLFIFIVAKLGAVVKNLERGLLFPIITALIEHIVNEMLSF